MTSYLMQAREWITPARQTSNLGKGVLTPAEFIQAGDELVFKCPTWSWEGGDPSKARSHLPKDKQYLITRNVPCSMRASTMENAVLGETEVEINENSNEKDINDSGGWLMSHLNNVEQKNTEPESMEDEFDLVDSDGEIISKPEKIIEEQKPKVEEEDNEYANMEDFEDSNILVDEATAPITSTTNNSTSSNIIKVRTYDVSITYDKYYQVPRVWIFGYGIDGAPLTTDEMFQDVMSDYVRQTVTIESHLNIPGPHLSIHPCQHANVMKNIIDNMMSKNSSAQPSADMYLFIFLKFVSSIIPTIQYDFTMEVEANVEKM